jgi:hypothetical protein
VFILNIQSIVLASSKRKLHGKAFLVAIDSTQPHLWLAKETCENFIDAFGLIWDPTTKFYLFSNKTSIFETDSLKFTLARGKEIYR